MNYDNLQILNQAQLINITRAGATVSITYQKYSRTFVMHIECFVRLLHDNKVYATSGDIIYPRNTPESWDSFDWNQFGNICCETIGVNLFDRRMEELFRESSFFIINNVIIDTIGNITILVNDNITLQIIIDNTKNDYEHWYFFEPINSNAPAFVRDKNIHYLNDD